MQLIIHTAKTKISVRNKAFLVSSPRRSQQIGPHRISSIAIWTHCEINAAAIKLAARHQIPIYFYTPPGELYARTCSRYMTNTAMLRRKQLLFYYTPGAVEWAKRLIRSKMDAQERLMLLYAATDKTHTRNALQAWDGLRQKLDALDAACIDRARKPLLGIEGTANRLYFAAMREWVPRNFRFTKRSRRPARDYFNAGLNYLYGMTYTVVEQGVHAKGLDPFAGFIHADNYRKPSLVFDLMEPVRPLIDKLWLDLLQENRMKPEHFTPVENGYWLSKEGKRIVIEHFNKKMHQRVKTGNHYLNLKSYIYMLSNELGNLIDSQTNPDELFDCL